MLLNTL